MTHHTWKHRFKTALKNKNWKKIAMHQTFEYSIIGTIVMSLEASPESWILGIVIAFIVHMVMFEAVDSLHKKGTHTHKYIPKWLHWVFDSDNLK
jgi:ABC-type polysaccharide transport system permease subunit